MRINYDQVTRMQYSRQSFLGRSTSWSSEKRKLIVSGLEGTVQFWLHSLYAGISLPWFYICEWKEKRYYQHLLWSKYQILWVLLYVLGITSWVHGLNVARNPNLEIVYYPTRETKIVFGAYFVLSRGLIRTGYLRSRTRCRQEYHEMGAIANMKLHKYNHSFILRAGTTRLTISKNSIEGRFGTSLQRFGRL